MTKEWIKTEFGDYLDLSEMQYVGNIYDDKLKRYKIIADSKNGKTYVIYTANQPGESGYLECIEIIKIIGSERISPALNIDYLSIVKKHQSSKR
jgi:hypothetical protein